MVIKLPGNSLIRLIMSKYSGSATPCLAVGMPGARSVWVRPRSAQLLPGAHLCLAVRMLREVRVQVLALVQSRAPAVLRAASGG